MIRMQRLNVVKYACDEKQAMELEARGFRRCAQKQESPQQEGDPGQAAAGSKKREAAAGRKRKNENG